MKLIVQRRIGGRRVVVVLASRPARRTPHVAVPATAAALGALYTLHHLGRGSGLAPGEAEESLPGDELVAQPLWQSTRAITIEAPPERVWPWIVQMGFPSQRAGWYTPHWLDRLTFGIEHRSADQIVPELQHLEAGDRVPDSEDGSAYFTVAEVDPPHALVLHSTRHLIKPVREIDFSWAFVIRELAPGRSRLLIRARVDYEPGWALPFVELVVGPADFANAGSMLRGIKRRVEGTTVGPAQAETDRGAHLVDLGEPRLEPERSNA